MSRFLAAVVITGFLVAVAAGLIGAFARIPEPQEVYEGAVRLLEAGQVDLDRGQEAFERSCAYCHVDHPKSAPQLFETLVARVRADERAAGRYILESALFPQRVVVPGYTDRMWRQGHVGEQGLADIAAMLVARVTLAELGAWRPR